MCDTIVATGSVTKDGITLLGKNSDREPNEAQYVCRKPAMEYPDDSFVQCTYIRIPQVRKTHAVLLSRPFWMWGAEMGVNEHGLAIGNEAVFTRIPCRKADALTGMDLLRLALERGETAAQAVTIITGLMKTYDQGGNCGYRNKMFYHNSYLLADPRETWLLETAGNHWAAKKITGVYAISNRLTIENNWDIASEDLVSHAIRKGWCKSEADFSFARCYSDRLYTGFSFAKFRRGRAMDLLQSKSGRIGIPDMAEILRDHGASAAESWGPDQSWIQSTICNHAGFGPVRISQTTGSMISHLTAENAVHFFTGTAAPCTSTFKPVWTDTKWPLEDQEPSRYFDETSLFWKHELLHRTILNDFYPLLSDYQKDRDQLETLFFTRAIELSGAEHNTRSAFVKDCFDQWMETENKWISRLKHQPVKRKCGLLYKMAWKKHNQTARLPVA
ncbi:MAG: C69 family dipeptidase [Pseudomonadota bacterium]